MQEPTRFQGDQGFREAFLEGIHEHNRFGAASSNAKYQVDENTAVTMFGFTVSWCSR